MTKPDLVETVAEIIAPRAFEMWQSLYNYCLPRDGEKKARWTAELAHGESCDGARTKARDILALPGLAPALGKDARALEAAADAYLSEYVMSTDGNDYEPTEIDRELLADCVDGLLADDGFNAALAAAPAPDLQAENERLRGVVERCRDVFAEYAELHRQKLGSNRPQGDAEFKAISAKVERNRDMADLCIAALSEPQTQERREADCDCCGERGPIAYREADTGALVCDRCAPLTTEGGE